MTQVKIEKSILQANEDIARELRSKFKDENITVINLISSPGAGKTTILEKTLPELSSKYKVAVIEGDVLTSRDAERIAKLQVPVVQIETKGACYLDAKMIKKALEELDLEGLDLLIIENVGNLVCPATFDLAEDAKVVILSVAEGSDKPAKYPTIFTRAKACLLNKIDLLPYSNFSLEDYYRDVKQINPKLQTFEVSAFTGEGLETFVEWLEGLVANGGQENRN